jgi:hypothetical protein
MISLKKHIQQRPWANFRPAHWHSEPRRSQDPFPLNGERAWDPKQSTAAAQGYSLTHSQPACLPACRQRPGPRAATTLKHPGTIQGQTQESTKQTGLATEMLLLSLRRALAPSHQTPAENMTLPSESPSDSGQPGCQRPYPQLPAFLNSLKLSYHQTPLRRGRK